MCDLVKIRDDVMKIRCSVTASIKVYIIEEEDKKKLPSWSQCFFQLFRLLYVAILNTCICMVDTYQIVAMA